MRWMKTLTRQYAWISGWLVILSLQDLNHLSPWWKWTLRKTLSSLPVDQVNQFIRLFRSQTQAILQFTTACSLIQQTLSKLILRMVWFRDRALVSSVSNSTQRRQEIITSKHSAFSTIIQRMFRKSTWLGTAMSQSCNCPTMRSSSSHLHSSASQPSNRWLSRMNQGSLSNTSGKCPISTRTR